MNNKIIKKFWVPAVFSVLALLIYAAIFIDFGSFNAPAGKGEKIEDLNSVTDEQLITILKTNADITDYIERNSDFRIESKEILTKDAILRGQNQNTFQPVYIALELEDARYMKVQLMNSQNSEGYIAVIDSRDSSVQKAFGLLLLKMTPPQTSAPAE